MKKLIIIFVAILLTACAAPSPQVTVTSDVTAILTTQTSTATPMTEAPTNFPPPTLAVTPENVIVPEEQQTISIEADSHVVVSSLENFRGWYQEATRKAAEKVVFPPLANNQGWEQPLGHSEKIASIVLVGNNTRLKNMNEQLISFAYLSGDILGHPEKELGIASFAVQDPDKKTISTFSVVAPPENLRKLIDQYYRNEISIGFLGWLSDDYMKTVVNNPDDWYVKPLIDLQGGKEKLLNISLDVVDKGKFSSDASQILWFAVSAN